MSEFSKTQPVKLVLSWDIRPGWEEQYLQFVTQEFTAGMLEGGLQTTDAWYTIYGPRRPEVTMGFLAMNLEAMKQFLASQAWAKLRRKLMEYVENYQQKVIHYKGGFQL